MSDKVYLIASSESNQRKELRNLLKYFYPLFDENRPLGKYRESKIFHYGVLKDSYKKIMRLNPMNGVHEVEYLFYSNLMEDFDPIITRVFPKIKIMGVVHDTYFDDRAYGYHAKNQAFEKCVLEIADYIFVGAEYIYDILVDKFPEYQHKFFLLFLPKLEYNENLLTTFMRDYEPPYKVLWNHRVSVNKGSKEFLEFAEYAMDTGDFVFHIATTGWTPQILKRFNDMRDKYPKKFFIHINPQDYEDIIDACDIGLTTSKHDTFGGSVMDCLNRGMPYVVPLRDGCAFNDFTIFDYCYDGNSEQPTWDIINVMDRLCKDREYRERCIIDQHTKLKDFSIETFIESIEIITGLKIPKRDREDKSDNSHLWDGAF